MKTPEEINENTMLVQLDDGRLYYKVDEEFILASMTDIQKHYKTMQYNLNMAIGLFATDRPDLIIDQKSILFEITYDQIPEKCQRIK